MSDNPVFDAYARYYDLLYRDKDYAAEVNYINSLLKEHGLSGNELLEFGSGTGKHGRLLAEKGYNVTGIELSDSMVQKAQKTDGFTCHQGDIRTVSLGRSFDAVLSLFHVISYQTTNANVQAVFHQASEHLQPGGLFIFDVWYSPAVYTQRPSVRVKRMKDKIVEITRIAEPAIFSNENRVDVHYTIYTRELATGIVKTLTETHPMRHFSLPEIDLLAAEKGFERIQTEEFLSGNPVGDDTWGVCVTLKRI